MSEQTPIEADRPELFYYNFSNDDFYTDKTPVDYHAINKDVVMPAPHNATRTPVPEDIPENKWPKYLRATDEWELVDSYVGTVYWNEDGEKFQIVQHGIAPPEGALFADPGPPLSVLIDRKSDELTTAYDTQVRTPVGFTSENGVAGEFQADQESLSRIVAALAGFDAVGEVPQGYYWLTADNVQVPFTKEDLRGLLAQVHVRNFKLFDKLQTLKALARESSKEDLKDIVWE